MIGVNVVNPMVNKKIDEILGLPEGVGTLHEALENYMGILNSPGSPAASSPESNAKGLQQHIKRQKNWILGLKIPALIIRVKILEKKGVMTMVEGILQKNIFIIIIKLK